MQNPKGRGRNATGSLTWHRGQWHVRVTRANGTRTPLIPLGSEVAESDVDAAKALAKKISNAVREGRAVDVAVPETVAEWIERWFALRETKGLNSVPSDRSRIKTHVTPVIGHLPMRSVKREDIERLVNKLDDKVIAGDIEWKTASNVWVVLRKMFADAKRSKRIELRVRTDDPCYDVEGPDRGSPRAKTHLYPDEFLRLVSCEKVPLNWRRLFAMAVYLYARRGELAALTRAEFDLEHQIVHIHCAETEKSGEVGETKTGVKRDFSFEPNLRPLLHVLCEGLGDDDFVLKLPSSGYMSRALRRYLKVAGVTRKDLHTRDKTRLPITFHDLRATGITWCNVRGDKPLQIMYQAGHANFATTKKYIRDIDEHTRRMYGAVFPPLPLSLVSGSHSAFSPFYKEVPTNNSQAYETAQGGGSPTPSVDIVEDFAEGAPKRREVARGGVTESQKNLTLLESIKLAAAAQQWEIVKVLSETLAKQI